MNKVEYYGIKDVDGIVYYLRHVQEDTYVWTVMKSKAHKFSFKEIKAAKEKHAEAEFVKTYLIDLGRPRTKGAEKSVKDANILNFINGEEVEFVRVNESQKEMTVYFKNGTMQTFKDVIIKVEGQDE
ncbi:hypothetical protein [Bacillus phage Nachito]|nr:hypothetical protein [Bacillus phage Nachito]